MNILLVVGAALSAVAAVLHLCVIAGGAPWYRFFGAGEEMARAAEAGRLFPAVVTFAIALVLALWAVYALSGAGAIRQLPWTKPALMAITSVYLARGLAVVPLLTWMRSESTPFLVWSSVICLGYGLVHLVGLMQVWSRLEAMGGPSMLAPRTP